jgi:hypothetical protein
MRKLMVTIWKAVGASLLCLSAVVAPTKAAYAVNTYDQRPFWSGVPVGGFLQECFGTIATKVNYGFIPARGVYTETKFSNGGFCNSTLGRAANKLRSTSSTWSGATLCGTTTVSNVNVSNSPLVLSWNVVAIGPPCSGALTRVSYTSEYLNAGVPINVGNLT